MEKWKSFMMRTQSGMRLMMIQWHLAKKQNLQEKRCILSCKSIQLMVFVDWCDYFSNNNVNPFMNGALLKLVPVQCLGYVFILHSVINKTVALCIGHKRAVFMLVLLLLLFILFCSISSDAFWKRGNLCIHWILLICLCHLPI